MHGLDLQRPCCDGAACVSVGQCIQSRQHHTSCMKHSQVQCRCAASWKLMPSGACQLWLHIRRHLYTFIAYIAACSQGQDRAAAVAGRNPVGGNPGDGGALRQAGADAHPQPDECGGAPQQQAPLEPLGRSSCYSSSAAVPCRNRSAVPCSLVHRYSFGRLCKPALRAKSGDAMPAQGIVSIPGMMTGQILGGSDPAQVRRATRQHA